MKTKLLLTSLLSFIFCLLSSQIPQGINYQAVARSNSGAIMNTALQVKASILSDTLTPVIVWEELHSSVKTNASGVFGIVIGTGTKQTGSASTFNDIDWTKTPLYLKIQIYYQGAWKYMGSSKLWSVPYSMVSGKTLDGSGLQTEMNTVETGAGLNDNGTYSANTSANFISPATSLKNADNLLDTKVKLNESGITALNAGMTSLNSSMTSQNTEVNAIETGAGLNDNGSYTANLLSNYIKTATNLKDADTKLDAQLKVNSDYIAANIVGNESKLVIKGVETSPDSALFRVRNKNGQTVFAVYNEGVRVYVDDGVAKSPKGGFSVGGFGTDKGTSQNLLTVTPDSVRVYVNKNAAKGAKGGFSIGGFDSGKGPSENFLELTPENYFIGHNSGKNITTGLYNSFLGYMSGYKNSTGSANTFFGDSTGLNNTSGSWNVFLGKNAGYSNETSISNVYIGDGAGELAKHSVTSSGSYNVAIGTLAGYTNNGKFNVFLGQEAGYSNLGGKQNVFIGMGAGYENDTADYNVAIGTYAGHENMGTANVFMGNFAGYANLGASYNLFLGNNAGQDNTTGEKNVILGSDAGYSNTTGNKNTFIGNLAGTSNLTGNSNLYAGYQAGYENTDGSFNVFLGQNAGLDALGSYNTLVGNAAGNGINADYNTMFGYQTGYYSSTGKGNAFFGHQSGYSNTTGEHNAFIGPIVSYYNETGSYNTALGYGAGNNNVSGSNNVFIGSLAGYYETTSDKLYIENSSNTATSALIYGDFYYDQLRLNAWVGINTAPSNTYRLYVNGNAFATGLWVTSDIRLKRNVKSLDSNGVLDKVKEVGVIQYNYSEEITKGDPTNNEKLIGVIAQDIEKSFPEAVKTDEKGYKAVSVNALTAILLQAIKDQQKQIDTLQKEVEELKAKK
jgi:hypothetical protein